MEHSTQPVYHDGIEKSYEKVTIAGEAFYISTRNETEKIIFLQDDK